MNGICVAVNATTSYSASSRYTTLKLWKSRPAAPMIKILVRMYTEYALTHRIESIAMASFPEKLNEQVAYEFAASQQYVAIAVWFDAETLPLLAAHFYRQALEERNHAMMIVQYLLDADHDVVIPAVEAPRTTFADAREPVALALEQEKRVTEQIAELARAAREENDLVGEQFMHWFLQEQREEVASMSDLLKIVERSSESNILLAEDYLARNPVGDQGEAANAPPAAGGAL